MELKTRPTKTSVAAFLNAIEDPQRRADCKAVAKLMRDVTGKAPTLWGRSRYETDLGAGAKKAQKSGVKKTA